MPEAWSITESCGPASPSISDDHVLVAGGIEQHHLDRRLVLVVLPHAVDRRGRHQMRVLGVCANPGLGRRYGQGAASLDHLPDHGGAEPLADLVEQSVDIAGIGREAGGRIALAELRGLHLPQQLAIDPALLPGRDNADANPAAVAAKLDHLGSAFHAVADRGGVGRVGAQVDEVGGNLVEIARAGERRRGERRHQQSGERAGLDGDHRDASGATTARTQNALRTAGFPQGCIRQSSRNCGPETCRRAWMLVPPAAWAKFCFTAGALKARSR